MLSATMMWAEFYTEGVTASEGSLLSGDENGDPLPCAFNKKGKCQVIQPKTALCCIPFRSLSAHPFTLRTYWKHSSVFSSLPFF